MKRIYLLKADQINQPIEDVEIIITSRMAEQTSLENERHMFKEQATKLYGALQQSLPAGTLDWLTVCLTERMRSALRVRDKDVTRRQL